MSAVLVSRAIGYVRVSTIQQAESGLGIEAQTASIRGECERRGWELVKIESDVVSSTKSLDDRKGLERAINAVEQGEADAIVIARLDRLIRSVKDFATLLERSRLHGWALVALDIAGVDTSTPTGEFLAHVLAAVAQLERRVISERTKAALAAKRRSGWRLGRPPKLPKETLQLIWLLHSEGLSDRKIAVELNRRGIRSATGRPWHESGRQVGIARCRASFVFDEEDDDDY
jgi:DNA invertase Pin-like site-specific DNA recombinase